MAFTYDLTTDAGKVRLLVPDRDETSAVFADDEVDAFLALEGGVYRAAALALETIAADTALTIRVTNLLGLNVDGTRASAELLKRAERLRAQAAAAVEDELGVEGLFDVAEWVIEPFGARERLHAERLRAWP
jgi:hypothetical protein